MNYLGISNEEWIILAEKTEAVLIENGIGQHIIGLYPFGNRLYGLKNSLPQLLCIYIDDPRRLLDPLDPLDPILSYQIDEEQNYTVFCNLSSWIKLLGQTTISNSINSNIKNFIHVIPSMSEAQYEDEQFSIIAAAAADYLETKKWDRYLSKNINFYLAKDRYSLIKEALYLRARTILNDRNQFAPCINAEWDTIEQIDYLNNEKIIAIDKQLIIEVTNNSGILSIEDLKYYIKYLIDNFNIDSIKNIEIPKYRLSHLVKTYLLSLL